MAEKKVHPTVQAWRDSTQRLREIAAKVEARQQARETKDAKR